mgnify:CR=1 FL=1
MVTEVDLIQPIRLAFKNWLDTLFMAQKYQKELKADSDELSALSGIFGR